MASIAACLLKGCSLRDLGLYICGSQQRTLWPVPRSLFEKCLELDLEGIVAKPEAGAEGQNNVGEGEEPGVHAGGRAAGVV